MFHFNEGGFATAEFTSRGGLSYLVGKAYVQGCGRVRAGIIGEPEDGLLLTFYWERSLIIIWEFPDPCSGSREVEFAILLGSFAPGNYPLMLWGVWPETPAVMTVPQIQEPALRLTPGSESLSFAINGFDEILYTVERSADLKAWTVAHQQTGTNAFTLPLGSGGTAGFYRLHAQNLP